MRIFPAFPFELYNTIQDHSVNSITPEPRRRRHPITVQFCCECTVPLQLYKLPLELTLSRTETISRFLTRLRRRRPALTRYKLQLLSSEKAPSFVAADRVFDVESRGTVRVIVQELCQARQHLQQSQQHQPSSDASPSLNF